MTRLAGYPAAGTGWRRRMSRSRRLSIGFLIGVLAERLNPLLITG
jgi:hypothetical protein